MYLLLFLILSIPFANAEIYLRCKVDGYIETLNSSKAEFKEQVSVEINEDGNTKLIRISGTNLTSATIIMEESKLLPQIKKTFYFPSETSWDIVNEGSSGKYKIFNHIIVHRMTGLIHVEKRFGEQSTFYGGPCEIAKSKKF